MCCLRVFFFICLSTEITPLSQVYVYMIYILIFNDNFARKKKIKGFEVLTYLELVGQESSYSYCTKGKGTKTTKFFIFISNHILIHDN